MGPVNLAAGTYRLNLLNASRRNPASRRELP